LGGWFWPTATFEGELASVGRRVGLASVYTTESLTESVSEVDDKSETVDLDVRIAFDVPLF
jgi:hypothetical protein